MARDVTREEVQAWLEDYYRSRTDLGLGKAILAMILEPAKLFEPQKSRPPKKSPVLLAIWLLGMLGVFVYFNLWS
jgi:hypothetical protein